MKTIKRLIQSTFGKFGYRLVRADAEVKPCYGWDPFFSLLKGFGFRPGFIIDVGANRGNWTREAVKFFPEADYLLIEPQEHLKVHVRDLIEQGYQIHWVNAGVGDQRGSLPFTVRDRDDSSSFVPLRQPTPAGSRQSTVEVRTLNEIVSSRNMPAPDMVKIDAEGFDLRVLSGASDLVGKTDVFLMEAMVCAPDYENTISEVIRRMSEAGYRLIDITDLNRSPKHGVLWVCELVFLRKGSSLLNGVNSYE